MSKEEDESHVGVSDYDWKSFSRVDEDEGGRKNPANQTDSVINSHRVGMWLSQDSFTIELATQLTLVGQPSRVGQRRMWRDQLTISPGSRVGIASCFRPYQIDNEGSVGWSTVRPVATLDFRP